jgi:hypothetical protein
VPPGHCRRFSLIHLGVVVRWAPHTPVFREAWSIAIALLGWASGEGQPEPEWWIRLKDTSPPYCTFAGLSTECLPDSDRLAWLAT